MLKVYEGHQAVGTVGRNAIRQGDPTNFKIKFYP
jgi:hypothetical protein